VDEQLRLAGQVQSDLLPEPLAETHPLEISTLYLPADYISGDIYDIARLDEHHIGFSIADATGHGLPAALLTFLIKKSLRGKEIFDHSYRIIEPDELLARLNEELLQASLSQCQFVTALHAIFDRRSDRMRWARGGCPYPILVRCGEPARLVTSDGGLIGAFEQRFEVVEHTLEPGDTLVFYSDGLDALLLHGSGPAARTLSETPWIRILEQQGPEPALQAVRELVARSAPSDWHADDITIIAIRMK
jgi:sigma-B regulation protein RsbU (phosphoserine phosphatase)